MPDSSAPQISTICPGCKNSVPADAFFCPHCGRKMKEPPPSLSIGSQMVIYLVSFFLPPFGLIPAVKYLRFGSQKGKIIGIIAIFLTIISITMSITMGLVIIEQFNKTLNSQMQIYNGLTY